MKITKRWLEKRGGRVEDFLTLNETDGIKIVKKLIRRKEYENANWLIIRLMKQSQHKKYMTFAFSQILPRFQTRCPGDECPQLAVDVFNNPPKKGTQMERYVIAQRASAAAMNAGHELLARDGNVNNYAAEVPYCAAWLAGSVAYAISRCYWAARQTIYKAARLILFATKRDDPIRAKVLKYGLSLF